MMHGQKNIKLYVTKLIVAFRHFANASIKY